MAIEHSVYASELDRRYMCKLGLSKDGIELLRTTEHVRVFVKPDTIETFSLNRFY